MTRPVVRQQLEAAALVKTLVELRLSACLAGLDRFQYVKDRVGQWHQVFDLAGSRAD